MTQYTFILDENILKAALSCSTMANDLFDLIKKNGHIIAADVRLLNSYWNMLSLHKGSMHHPFLSKTIGYITRDNTQFDFVPELQVEEENIPIRHRNDVFLGQIARELQVISICVVCKDKRTREDFNNRMNILAVSLRNSIQYASQMDC